MPQAIPAAVNPGTAGDFLVDIFIGALQKIMGAFNN
jgi:hypothetical protein